MAELIDVTELQGEVAQHVIFVHGLGGHCHDTWQAEDDQDMFWPYWLAEDIKELSIWTVCYDDPVSHWRGSAMHLTDRALNVLERILAEPKLHSGEIILIGHSLGGLVIKQLLRTAESMALKREDASNFIKRVRRVAFLATPHFGSDLAVWGDRLRIVVFPSAATASLVRNDPNLRDLNTWYRRWSHTEKIEHLILVETKPIKKFLLVVKADSSDPGLLSDPIPIDADHFNICKPKNRTSEIYIYIRNFISRQIDSIYSTLFMEQQIQKLIDSPQKYPKELVDSEIKKQLSIIQRFRFFTGFATAEHSIRLAEDILNGEFQSASCALKSTALAWCARILSVGKNSADINELLIQAKKWGSGEEVTIAEAFINSANGKYEEGLSSLASIKTPASYSAMFFIVSNRNNASAAIEWLSNAGIEFSDFDAEGKFLFLSKLFELEHWETSIECVNALSQEDFEQSPILFYSAAMANLVQTIPQEIKASVFLQVPFAARTFPLASDKAALVFRKQAQELFYQCSLVIKELGCNKATDIVSDYSLWLELRDPEGMESGREKLKESMSKKEHSLRRLPLALQFGLSLDLEAIEQEIERETVISGGTSQNAALARFALIFTQKEPKDVIAYIDRHRIQLEKHLVKKSIRMLEIEMFVKSGLLLEAEKCFADLTSDGLSEGEINHIRRIIDESGGADPIEALKAEFKASNQLNDLVNLVNLLEEKNDWSSLCDYGSLLFERTHSLADAERLAMTLNNSHHYDELAELLRKYPEFLDQSDNLQIFWSWTLYSEGLLAESKVALEKLRVKRDHLSDRTLLVNLAIASGKWEEILLYIEQEWIHKEHREASELMTTAQLALSVNSPRAQDLIYAAAEKGENDPDILAGAYFHATRAGWEDKETVAKWLHDAVKYSGNSGPIQQMDISEFMGQLPDWNQQKMDTLQMLYEGTLPIFGVARRINKSLIDMFLLPALINPSEEDPRKYILIPAYSGVRQPLSCPHKVVGIDATALLTLASTNLLEVFGSAFEKIVIPHSTLGWLFEEKQKVSFHQPSKIREASKLRQMLSSGTLQVFNGSATIDMDLTHEVGIDLASLIAEAQVENGEDGKQVVVIRSSPVHRINTLMQEEADLSLYSSSICSCLSVVKKLKQKGQLTEAEEELAYSYLNLHDTGWPHEPEIADNAVLYLDDLAVNYLQHTGLLEKLRTAGLKAYISEREDEESNALLRYDQLSNQIHKTIDNIKSFLETGIKTGKIELGKAFHDNGKENETLEHHPTFSIFNLKKDVDAIIVDDRALNRHSYLDTGSSKISILNTLDIINALHIKDDITQSKMYEYKTALRRSGYLFVPITGDEIEYYLSASDVSNGSFVETAELKAIRENFLSIRMSHFLELPKKALWLTDILHVFRSALQAQWYSDFDETIAIARSEWLLELLDLRGWAHCQSADSSNGMALYGYGSQVNALIIAPFGMTNDIREKYWKWIEKKVLKEIQEEDPELYAWLLKEAKDLISKQMNTDFLKEQNSGDS